MLLNYCFFYVDWSCAEVIQVVFVEVPAESERVVMSEFLDKDNSSIDEKSDSRKNEIIAILQICIGVFILSSLIFDLEDYNRVGPAGRFIRDMLVFLFGVYASYVIPALLIMSGLTLIVNSNFMAKLWIKLLAFSMIIISLCCLLCLPHIYDLNNAQAYRSGGVLGCFIMGYDGLGACYYLGYLGCALICAAMLIISMLLITNILIIDMAKGFYRFFRKSISFVEDLYDGISDYKRTVFGSDKSYPSNISVDHAHHDFAEEEKTGDRFAADEDASDFDQIASDIVKASPPSPPKGIVEDDEQEDYSENEEQPAAFAELDEAADNQIMDDDKYAEDVNLETDYTLPNLNLLESPKNTDTRMPEDELMKLSETLERTLSEFGITAHVNQITQGPVVTRFELQPAPGVKISRIVGLEHNIAMALEALHVRIIAPIPGKSVVGIEVPKKKPSRVYLREILMSDEMRTNQYPLAFALGKTISGEPYICNLASMPHLLIAGATGAGKSVCLNSIIMSILFRMPPERVKFIMIDPKRVELSIYQDIPHLLAPVVCEPRKAASALAWAIEQMEQRYKKLLEVGVRNITGYNNIAEGRAVSHKLKNKKLEYMPHIVIIIDELADLMLVAKNDVEEYVIRLAQLSRAVGMHLIIATQRPSVNVITGIIKANFPTRIAFQVSSKVDSRTILDTNGAEALLGRGDMLFSQAGMPKPNRVQGAFVSDEEVERSVEFILSQRRAKYVKEDFSVKIVQEQLSFDEELGVDYPEEDREQSSQSGGPVEEYLNDEELAYKAAILILENDKASVSLIQRRLRIGYARAGRLMDILEEKGIVGPFLGSKPRDILVDPKEYLAKLRELGRFPD